MYLLTAVFCLWILFFGGAGRIENTILGYFEFGQAAEKVIFIKIVAWVGLMGSIAIFVTDNFS